MVESVIYYCESGDEKDRPTLEEFEMMIRLCQPTREELIEQMHFHQQKATEILIKLNESPTIQVGEIPATLWSSHSTGHDQQ